VALNVAPDGSVSVNSASNSAAPGDYITLFGVGLGTYLPSHQPPPDGSAVSTADPFSAGPAVFLDALEDAIVYDLAQPHQTGFLIPTYAGAAPTLVGVHQVNFQVPQGTRNGCAVPLTINAFQLSPTVSIAVNTSRGPCADPPAQSYGDVTFVKTIASGTSSDGVTEQFAAVFPSGPALQQPPALTVSPGTSMFASNVVPSGRTCSVAGYQSLSVGTLQIGTVGRGVVSIPPTNQGGQVSYRQELPSGSIVPGQLTVSTQGGAPVTFQETLTVGSPIQIQNPPAPGNLSAGDHPAIHWTGGSADEVVRLTLGSDVPQINGNYALATARGDAGVLAIPISCAQTGTSCYFGVQPSSPVQLTVEVLPAGGTADSITALGISQRVRFNWSYKYIFGGITLTN
jgi:hypothetical protein